MCSTERGRERERGTRLVSPEDRLVGRVEDVLHRVLLRTLRRNC